MPAHSPSSPPPPSLWSRPVPSRPPRRGGPGRGGVAGVLYAAGSRLLLELRVAAAPERSEPGRGRGEDRNRGGGRRRRSKRAAAGVLLLFRTCRRPGHVAPPLSPALRTQSLDPHAVARHHGQRGERRGWLGKLTAGSGKFKEPDHGCSPFPSSCGGRGSALSVSAKEGVRARPRRGRGGLVNGSGR